mgnify:CR=1 FL=1
MVASTKQKTRRVNRTSKQPKSERILDVAERGRSLGIILIGAQQTASEVERRVVANSAVRVVGRLDAAEAARGASGHGRGPADPGSRRRQRSAHRDRAGGFDGPAARGLPREGPGRGALRVLPGHGQPEACPGPGLPRAGKYAPHRGR